MSALNFTDKDSINRYIDGVKNKTAITTPITWSAANKHLIDEFMNIIERSFEVLILLKAFRLYMLLLQPILFSVCCDSHIFGLIYGNVIEN